MKVMKHLSDKTGELHEYIAIDELPSGFRSYETNVVYVRGLFYEEVLALAKYVGDTPNPSLLQLSAIYSDVIKGIDINDLELIDFTTLIAVSSIWTSDDFGWSPNLSCAMDSCDGIITNPIVLDDFEFNDPLLKSKVPYSIKGINTFIGPITVGDEIKKNKLLESHEDIHKNIISFALMIKTDELTDEEKIKAIRFADPKQINEIAMLEKELFIAIKPIPKPCPKCGHINKVYIGLEKIRAFP